MIGLFGSVPMNLTVSVKWWKIMVTSPELAAAILAAEASIAALFRGAAGDKEENSTRKNTALAIGNISRYFFILASRKHS